VEDTCIETTKRAHFVRDDQEVLQEVLQRPIASFFVVNYLNKAVHSVAALDNWY